MIYLDKVLFLHDDEINCLDRDNLSIDIEKDYNNDNGIGLGLSLVKLLSEKMDIKLNCDSLINGGSKVSLVLKGIPTEEISTLKDCHKNFQENLIQTMVDYSDINNDFQSYKDSEISSDYADVSLQKECSNLNFSLNNYKYLEASKLNNDNLPLIFVCDDAKIVRDSLITILNNIESIKNNYNIKIGNDGVDILSHIINEPRIKVIITDENMEFLNGSDAVHMLRDFEKRGKLESKMYISTTAFSDEQTIKNIKKAGFDDILIKPITKDKIFTTFNRLNLLSISDDVIK